MHFPPGVICRPRLKGFLSVDLNYVQYNVGLSSGDGAISLSIPDGFQSQPRRSGGERERSRATPGEAALCRAELGHGVG